MCFGYSCPCGKLSWISRGGGENGLGQGKGQEVTLKHKGITKVIVQYQGKGIEATEVEVITANEPWSEYRLSDGKILSVKNVLISVFRAVDVKSPD